jgi:hypothetical protein
MIQIGAVQQGEHIGISHVPQFVADRRAEILHDKSIARFAIIAAAAALSDGQLDFGHKDSSQMI